MRNINENDIFSLAVAVSDELTLQSASCCILSAVASAQIDVCQIDELWATVCKMPTIASQRSFLLNSAINAANNTAPNNVPNVASKSVLRLLRMLVEISPESSFVAGRLAETFLDNNDTATAIEIINAVKEPFDSWRSRAEFAVKLLTKDTAAGRRIIETIKETDYYDWGQLALAKRLIELDNFDEAKKTANKCSSPLRRAWAFFEMSKVNNEKNSPDSKRTEELLKHVAEILEEMDVDSKNAESYVTALRIIGQSICSQNKNITGKKNKAPQTKAPQTKESQTEDSKNDNTKNVQNNRVGDLIGERFLELAEGGIDKISMPVQRLRAKYFLAGTLLELGMIDSVSNYVDRNELMNDGDLTALERSRVLQWSAESDARLEADWYEAIKVISKAKRTEEEGFAERIAEIVRRFTTRNDNKKPTGKPAEDTIILPARKFEEYYFSPFAIPDCGC